jgi:phospholipid/cholesterol/gamma-HCH transport system permease protein
MRHLLSALGAGALTGLKLVGQTLLLTGRLVRALPHLNWGELRRALLLFGYQSIPLAIGTACLIGATVVLQAGVYVNTFGARLYTGWAASYALMWEFGPLLLGLVIAARIGARNAAEFGLLATNGHLEGFRGISLDIYALLVAPRVLAQSLSVLLLSSVSFSVAILFEAVAAYFTLHLPTRVFMGAFSEMIHVGDLLGGLTKSLAFGVSIAILSTCLGLKATGGARGVGRAAAQAVVLGSATIFALDFLLTPLLIRALS